VRLMSRAPSRASSLLTAFEDPWCKWLSLLVGVVMALVPILLGQASVLYTFYPPLAASP
jgi:heme/copper-type cytochrome/quinol oxidase subunit 1